MYSQCSKCIMCYLKFYVVLYFGSGPIIIWPGETADCGNETFNHIIQIWFTEHYNWLRLGTYYKINVFLRPNNNDNKYF